LAASREGGWNKGKEVCLGRLQGWAGAIGEKKSVSRDKALSWQRRGVVGEMRLQGKGGRVRQGKRSLSGQTSGEGGRVRQGRRNLSWQIPGREGAMANSGRAGETCVLLIAPIDRFNMRWVERYSAQ